MKVPSHLVILQSLREFTAIIRSQSCLTILVAYRSVRTISRIRKKKFKIELDTTKDKSPYSRYTLLIINSNNIY